jgi:hypothetical protein
MASKHSFKTKPKWGIVILVVVLVLGAYFMQEYRTSNSIDDCPRYTIAYSTTIGRKDVNYRYEILNKTFTGTWTVNPRSFSEFVIFDLYPKDFMNQRCLLRVNCNKPDVSEIDWTHLVPINVESAPEEGWEAIPEDFPETKFAD